MSRPTSDPRVDYAVPRGVGVTQVAYETLRKPLTAHFTTREFFDDIAGHGIRIAKIWLENDPFDGVYRWSWTLADGTVMDGMGSKDPLFEDMDRVWKHPGIDVIVVRFVNAAWTAHEKHCSGWNGPTFAQEPTYEIARRLLKRYGDQPKVIIFSNWEGDNQWRGAGCNKPDMAMWDSASPWYSGACRDENTVAECAEMLCRDRMNYVKRRTEERQAAIEKARRKFPDTTLKIYHALVVDDFDEEPGHFGMNLIKDMVPHLKRSPDFIGVSYWLKSLKTIAEVFDYIHDHTGFPAHRCYIDEVGAKEKSEGLQRDRLMDVIPEAFETGYAFACVWMWKQTWYNWTSGGRPRNAGMWKWAGDSGKVEWSDEPNSGLQAILDLNEQYGG
jgi:hypothetical protein